VGGFVFFLILGVIIWFLWSMFFAGRGTCANCKQSYKIIHWKADGKKFCTKRCMSEYFRCQVCGRPSKYQTEDGYFCSKKCLNSVLNSRKKATAFSLKCPKCGHLNLSADWRCSECFYEFNKGTIKDVKYTKKIPKCICEYDSEWGGKKFYKYFEKQIKNNIFIDIEGNFGYVCEYLSTIVDRFLEAGTESGYYVNPGVEIPEDNSMLFDLKDVTYKSSLKLANEDIYDLLDHFEKIRKVYGEYERVVDKLDSYTDYAYLYMKDYEKAWELKRKSRYISIDYIMTVGIKCKDTSIDGWNLISINKSDTGLTKFGEENINKMAQLTTNYLVKFYNEHKMNLVEYYCTKLNYKNMGEKELLHLKELYPNEDEFFRWEKINKRTGIEGKNYGYGWNSSSNMEPVHMLLSVGIGYEIKRILRECENELREKQGLPRVGEGWISETELYCKICDAFPEEKVIQHGRPRWLKRQHLDIYFPKRNIAIEYQGGQHQKPVEFFGGEKAFEKIKELDRKKRELSEKHGCKLIYADVGYDFENVKQKIEDILSKKPKIVYKRKDKIQDNVLL